MEKVDALFVELAKRRESPKYGEALQEFRTAVDTHPDAEKMETLYQVAKRTFSSNGQNGFIAPLPYSNEADAYAASVRFLAKEALDAGYKGVIIPDAARLETINAVLMVVVALRVTSTSSNPCMAMR